MNQFLYFPVSTVELGGKEGSKQDAMFSCVMESSANLMINRKPKQTPSTLAARVSDGQSTKTKSFFAKYK